MLLKSVFAVSQREVLNIEDIEERMFAPKKAKTASKSFFKFHVYVKRRHWLKKPWPVGCMMQIIITTSTKCVQSDKRCINIIKSILQ